MLPHCLMLNICAASAPAHTSTSLCMVSPPPLGPRLASGHAIPRVYVLMHRKLERLAHETPSHRRLQRNWEIMTAAEDSRREEHTQTVQSAMDCRIRDAPTTAMIHGLAVLAALEGAGA